MKRLSLKHTVTARFEQGSNRSWERLLSHPWSLPSPKDKKSPRVPPGPFGRLTKVKTRDGEQRPRGVKAETIGKELGDSQVFLVGQSHPERARSTHAALRAGARPGGKGHLAWGLPRAKPQP